MRDFQYTQQNSDGLNVLYILVNEMFSFKETTVQGQWRTERFKFVIYRVDKGANYHPKKRLNLTF